MPTECSPALFEFAPVAGRRVVARFDGGAITSDAGALLLGQTDHAIRLTVSGLFPPPWRDGGLCADGSAWTANMQGSSKTVR
jgi:hypothetical protein